MRLRTTRAGAVLLVAGLLALTACGTTRTGGAAVVNPTASPVTPTASPVNPTASPETAHAEPFPEVAAQCAGKSAGTTGAQPDGTGGPATASPEAEPDDLPTDPEARKYAENHAYKSTVPLTAEAKCRGTAHARRISTALGGHAGAARPRTEQELGGVLRGLGYRVSAGEVYTSGGTLGFTVWVPENGPCVTGSLGEPLRIEAHGVHMEGGCLEPRGGH